MTNEPLDVTDILDFKQRPLSTIYGPDHPVYGRRLEREHVVEQLTKRIRERGERLSAAHARVQTTDAAYDAAVRAASFDSGSAGEPKAVTSAREARDAAVADESGLKAELLPLQDADKRRREALDRELGHHAFVDDPDLAVELHRAEVEELVDAFHAHQRELSTIALHISQAGERLADAMELHDSVTTTIRAPTVRTWARDFLASVHALRASGDGDITPRKIFETDLDGVDLDPDAARAHLDASRQRLADLDADALADPPACAAQHVHAFRARRVPSARAA